MKSIKNHFSLIVALVSILFAIQVFVIVDRSIDAYKKNLAKSYAVIVLSQTTISQERFKLLDSVIYNVEELSPDSVIKRLNTKIDKKNIELLKITLPKFYKVQLKHFPTPNEIKRLTRNLLKHNAISKVENFAYNHDSTFKLLLLFKDVIAVFTLAVFIVTILLILKELRIWQFTHNERMSIMGLFGAPIWLSSAVLFRLAIVDAVISSIFIYMIFSYVKTSEWILGQLKNIGIDIVIFHSLDDFLILFAIAISLSILLASLIVVGHKEEV